MTSLDWKVILLVFGGLLVFLTAVISIILWSSRKTVNALRSSIEHQNQRLDEILKDLRK